MAQNTTDILGSFEPTVRRQRGDDFPMRVTEQGAVRVNVSYVERDYGDCLLIYVDLHSKRANLLCIGSGDDCGPSMYLVADENSLHLDETKARDEPTCIEFHHHKGWSVFCANGTARYTFALTLLSPEA